MSGEEDEPMIVEDCECAGSGILTIRGGHGGDTRLNNKKCMVCAENIATAPCIQNKWIDTCVSCTGLEFYSKPFIFARAVVSSEEQELFNNDLIAVVKSINKNGARQRARTQLWFPIVDSTPGRRLINSNNRASAAIVLEAMYKREMHARRTVPVGVALINSDSLADRNAILDECAFSNADLCTGRVTILWFSPQLIARGENDRSAVRDWNALWDMTNEVIHASVHATIDTISKSLAYVPAINTRTFYLDRWAMTSALVMWCSWQGLWTYAAVTHGDGDGYRSLYLHEYVLLLFHVYLRYRGDSVPLLHTTKYIAQHMRIPVQNADKHAAQLSTEAVFRDMGRIDAQHNRTFLKTDLPPLLEVFHDLWDRYEKCRKLVYDHVSQPMQALRDRLPAYPLYLGHRLTTFTHHCIRTTPENPTDVDAYVRWALSCRKKLDDDHSMIKVFESVYRDALTVTTKEADLYLYGNMQVAVDDARRAKKRALQEMGLDTSSIRRTVIEHRPVTVGALSDPRSRAKMALYGNQRRCSEFDVAACDGGMHSETSSRLDDATTTRTPVWASYLPRGTGFSFAMYNTFYVDIDDRDVQAPPPPPKDDYSPYPEGELEYVQSNMHCSQIYADLDLRVPQGACLSFGLATFCQDLTQCLLRVARSLAVPVQHVYVFKSRDGTESMNDDHNTHTRDGKLGLHLHAPLCPGTVMTTFAVKQFIHIMEMIRHAKPATLGQGHFSSELFDPCVYPVGDYKGHCFRSPYRGKADGKRVLDCVYRSDEGDVDNPIAKRYQFVHGPQFRTIAMSSDSTEALGDRVFRGTVIERIEGIHEITDEAFIYRHTKEAVNKYVRELGHYTPVHVMQEINKRRIIFLSEDDKDIRYAHDLERLLTMLNSLLSNTGTLPTLANVMRRAVGADGMKHAKQDIHNVLTKSRIVFHKETKTLCVEVNGSVWLPFCARRPHRKPVTRKSCRLIVMYYHGMVRFGFLASCRKASCKMGSSSFMAEVMMPMQEIFITREERTDVELRVARTLHNDLLKCYKIEEIFEDGKDSERSIIAVPEQPSPIGVKNILSDAHSIRNVYVNVHLNRNSALLVVRLENGYGAFLSVGHVNKPEIRDDYVDAYTPQHSMALMCDQMSHLIEALEMGKFLNSRIIDQLRSIV